MAYRTPEANRAAVKRWKAENHEALRLQKQRYHARRRNPVYMASLKRTQQRDTILNPKSTEEESKPCRPASASEPTPQETKS